MERKTLRPHDLDSVNYSGSIYRWVNWMKEFHLKLSQYDIEKSLNQETDRIKTILISTNTAN